jgi:hypothetical protein
MEPEYYCLNCTWCGSEEDLDFDSRLAGDETIEDMRCPECGGGVKEKAIF